MGVRDGRNDAKSSTPPILPLLLLQSDKRSEALKGRLHVLVLPLIVAVALDSIFQIVIFGVWRLQWALVVGVCLVGIPYILTREITNRIFSARRGNEATSQ
jgi:membrane protein required for beta-lactamase induction